MGCLAKDDNFFGNIHEDESPHDNNPLDHLGPAIVLEDDYDTEMFPSLDPDHHPYSLDEDRCTY